MSSQVMSPVDLVMGQENLFAGALNSDAVVWAKESQFAVQHLTKNDYITKIAMANQTSVQNAIINVAAIGISLNPASKHAYLVPRDGAICLDVSYMGLMHLAKKTGALLEVEAKLVYESDTYENNGIGERPTHKSNTFAKDKGAVVGAYCVALKTGGYWLVEEMDIEALNKVKSTSKAAKGPWKTWPEEMMRKTVVKRASKYWQCGAVDAAVDVLNQHEGLADIAVVESNPQAFSGDIPRTPHTQEQLDYFHGALKNGDEMAVFCVYNVIDEGVKNSLLSTFPYGQKGKMTEVALGLKRSAEQTIESYICALTDSAGDDSGTAELIQEMSSIPKRIVEGFIIPKLDSETEMYVRKMMA